MTDDGLHHFEQVDMRLGRIVEVEDFSEARKLAFKLAIDFGQLGLRRSSAQLTVHYTKESLLGRLVVAVTSLPLRRIAGFKSEVLVLGVPDADGNVILLAPEREAHLGGRVF
jgi:tRNA-binding protein